VGGIVSNFLGGILHSARLIAVVAVRLFLFPAAGWILTVVWEMPKLPLSSCQPPNHHQCKLRDEGKMRTVFGFEMSSAG
jgi:hypothetical protein